MRCDPHPPLPSALTRLTWRSLAAGMALWCAATSHAWAIEKITLWPTILFLRGQDLCQFQDAYGKSRNESAM